MMAEIDQTEIDEVQVTESPDDEAFSTPPRAEENVAGKKRRQNAWILFVVGILVGG